MSLGNQCRARARVSCAAGLVAAAGLAGIASGQSVIRPASDSGWALAPAGGGVPNPFSFYLRVGTANNAAYTPVQGFSTAATVFDTARPRISGGAYNNGDATTDEFSFAMRARRSFTVLENATLYMPSMISGLISIMNTGGAGTVFGAMHGTLELFRETAPGVWTSQGVVFDHSLSRTATTNGDGNFNVGDGWHVPSANVAAGNFRIDATYQINGAALNNSPVNSEVRVDGTNNFGPRAGLVTSVSAVPQGFGADSRAAVRAPQARTRFGVTGNNVVVGILEPGDPYTTHTALAAGRFTLVHGNANMGADFRDEHALATSSIIGANVGNASQAGIAPGVTFVSTALNSFVSSPATLTNMANNGVGVINMSAVAGGISVNDVDTFLNNNALISFVKSAGNSGFNQAANTNTITNPGMAWNAIAVGSLNRNFTRRADFSSYNGTNTGPQKPDLVAPGEYVLAASAIDTNRGGAINDFVRYFSGDDFSHFNGGVTGDVTGTSFAAPHVVGTIALMHEYAATRAAAFDAASIDHRVMKAVAVNSANTAVFQTNNNATPDLPGVQGSAWSQGTNGGAATPGNVLVVNRPLDRQLGGGMLDTFNALRTFATGEVRQADNNAAQHFVIDAQPFISGPTGQNGVLVGGRVNNLRGTWDLENVGAAGGGANGRVDYLLGDIVGEDLRTTLTWDRRAADNILPRLELRLYLEGQTPASMAGFDATDTLLAQTVHTTVLHNVALFDFTVPDPGVANPAFFVEVFNPGNLAWTYAIVIQVVPDPAAGVLLVTLGLAAVRRRRRG